MLIKLGLIEDSPTLREYFVDFFKRCPEFEMLFAVSDLKDLYRVNSALRPDIILLDIMLPSGNSLKSIGKIKQLFPYSHVVILSAVDDPAASHTALINGAKGFLSKNSSSEFIKDALLKTFEGGTPLSPSIVNHLIDVKGSRPQNLTDIFPELTRRELDLCNLIVTGMSNKMIASTMNITPFTVNEHLKHIYKKLNINSKGELISQIMRA
ncbi:MAG: response regulator transcription factor [Bacteroidetes bacterium]|nr:response regulator transcription factor [Bacteroidota bacterium]